MLKNCSDKLRTAIERCSNSTGAEQAVPAKNILAAIRGTDVEANAVNWNAQSEAPVGSSHRAASTTGCQPTGDRSCRSGPSGSCGKASERQEKGGRQASEESISENDTTCFADAATDRKWQSQRTEWWNCAACRDKATPLFISYPAFTESVLKIKHAIEARGIPVGWPPRIWWATCKTRSARRLWSHMQSLSATPIPIAIPCKCSLFWFALQQCEVVNWILLHKDCYFNSYKAIEI